MNKYRYEWKSSPQWEREFKRLSFRIGERLLILQPSWQPPKWYRWDCAVKIGRWILALSTSPFRVGAKAK